MANEKRLISVDAHELEELLSDCFDVIKSVKPTHLSLMGALQVWIGCCKGQPTVDAVEVVRCKDCKYFRKGKPFRHECRKVGGGMFYPNPDDFCSYGERREGE